MQPNRKKFIHGVFAAFVWGSAGGDFSVNLPGFAFVNPYLAFFFEGKGKQQSSRQTAGVCVSCKRKQVSESFLEEISIEVTQMQMLKPTGSCWACGLMGLSAFSSFHSCLNTRIYLCGFSISVGEISP